MTQNRRFLSEHEHNFSNVRKEAVLLRGGWLLESTEVSPNQPVCTRLSVDGPRHDIKKKAKENGHGLSKKKRSNLIPHKLLLPFRAGTHSVDERMSQSTIIVVLVVFSFGAVLYHRWKALAKKSTGRLFVGPGGAAAEETGPKDRVVTFFEVVERMRNNSKFDWQFRPGWPLLSAFVSLFPGGVENIGHLQTILSVLRRFPQHCEFLRESIPLSDGGIVYIDWLKPNHIAFPSEWNEDTPITIVLHGVCGGSGENYIQHILVNLARAGFRPGCFNYRGAGDTVLFTPYMYSAGQTHDVREVVQAVHERFQRAPITLVGYSLGANITAKFLGEEGGLFSSSCSHVPPNYTHRQIDVSGADASKYLGGSDRYKDYLAGAVVISNLFDLNACSVYMHEQSYFGPLYGRLLTKNLRNYLLRHMQVWQKLAREEGTNADAVDTARQAVREFCDCNAISKVQTVREFDELATRRLFGFRTLEEYYDRCSSKAFLSHVKVPLLCISSHDDPLAPGSVVPTDSMDEFSWPKQCAEAMSPVLLQRASSEHNLNVSAEVGVFLTETGGHVAWIERQNWWPLWSVEESAWSDNAAVCFLSAAVDTWRETYKT